MHLAARALLLSLLLLHVPLTARADESFTDWYLKKLEVQASTTSLRREDKAVVKARHADRFISELSQRFGGLTLRDVPPQGRVNVTRTYYLNTGDQLPSLLGLEKTPKGSISPKIRIRSYHTRSAKGGKTTPAPITDGISLLEIKMPHPHRPGVSLKPRLFVNNNHLKLLLDRDTFNDPTTRHQVVQTLKADQRNDAETVDRMVGVLGGLHAHHKGRKLKPWIQTQYQRTAYMLPITGGGNVQVTVDRKVKFRKARKKGKVLERFDRSWRAVEVKIPDEYAAMSDGQLQSRGLGVVAGVRGLQRSILQRNQVKPLQSGRGKCAAFSRLSRHKARTLKARGHWR
jgi:hypothetical protein